MHVPAAIERGWLATDTENRGTQSALQTTDATAPS
jgi:hypothetical protein